MALYLHLGPFAQYVVREIDRQIANLSKQPTSACGAPL
jgi:hypothetical protein